MIASVASGATSGPSGNSGTPPRSKTGRVGVVLGLIVAIAIVIGISQYRPLTSTPCTSIRRSGVEAPALSAATDVLIVDAAAAATHVDGTTAVATLDRAGLARGSTLRLPTTEGNTKSIRSIAAIEPLGTTGHQVPPLAIITCTGGSRAVIDLASGMPLRSLPDRSDATIRLPGRDGMQPPFYLAPANDDHTDWTIIDVRTGDRRLLSDAIGLPGNEGILPLSADHYQGDTWVVRYAFADERDSASVSKSDGTFAIAGDIDRITALPGYTRYSVHPGAHWFAVSPDGRVVAWEINEDDDRIAVVETSTGRQTARYGTDIVGSLPAIAGFARDGQLIVTSEDRVLALDPTDDARGARIITEGLSNLGNSLVFAPANVIFVLQIDRILRVELDSGNVTEVWGGPTPRLFDFTRPDAGWITFQTDEEQVLLDATTGELVSRIALPPGNLATQSANPFELSYDTLGGVSASGDTIIGYERGFGGSSVWILSPAFPNGLVLGNFTFASFAISWDGSTVFAFTQTERFGGPDRVWVSPVSPSAHWRVIAEDIDAAIYIPLRDSP